MIKENQELHYKNLLSFRGKFTEKDMQKKIKKLDKFINDNNLTITGPKISTTYSLTQSTVDLEILIPVDKEFKETDQFKFKPELKLINALKSTHKGNPQGFNNTVIEMEKYIQDKKLMPITSLYSVNVTEVTCVEDIDKFHTDIFIAINPNIF